MSYEVLSGEGWYKIAKKTGIDVNTLLEANGATLDTVIHPGLKLKLSKTDDKPAERKKVLSSKSKPIKMDNPMLDRGFPVDALAVATPYKVLPRGIKPPKPIDLDPNVNTLEKQQALYDAGYNLGTSGKNKNGVDGNWGKKSQSAWDLAMSDGYYWDGSKLARDVTYATPHVDERWDRMVNRRLSGIYDNMYPYSYGDVTDANGVTRQVTGKESEEVQARAAIDKITAAKKGMDPRRDMMNRMAALDLNTEEGMAEWKRLASEANKMQHKMVRYGGTTPEQIRNQQWEMRARLDAMNLHQGRNLQWNTFIEQSDKAKRSGRATAAGRPTLIIADPHQRRRINGEMLNYWKAHQNDVVKGDSGLRLLPFMSYLGNATIVEQADGSLRYADDWDYAHDSTIGYDGRPYFGEVLSDFSGDGYGYGVNSRAFSEGLEDFGGALKEVYTQKASEAVHNVKEGLHDVAGNALKYAKSVYLSAPRMFTYAAPIMRTIR